MDNMTVRIYTDGGSRNNPGEAGAGAVIYRGDERVAEISKYLGIQTNNAAEYDALILALERALELGFSGETVEVRADSKLVVEQVQGNWKVKEISLKPKVQRAQELISKFSDISLMHVLRAENKEADALANAAMDRKE